MQTVSSQYPHSVKYPYRHLKPITLLCPTTAHCKPSGWQHVTASSASNSKAMCEPFLLYKAGVYLVHISQPHYHAQHYLGYSKNIDARLDTHWKGPRDKASKLL